MRCSVVNGEGTMEFSGGGNGIGTSLVHRDGGRSVGGAGSA